MNKNFHPPTVSQIVPLFGAAIVLTSVDLTKMEGTYKLFENCEQAMEACHQHSLEQLPKWHAVHCSTCAERAAQLKGDSSA